MTIVPLCSSLGHNRSRCDTKRRPRIYRGSLSLVRLIVDIESETDVFWLLFDRVVTELSRMHWSISPFTCLSSYPTSCCRRETVLIAVTCPKKVVIGLKKKVQHMTWVWQIPHLRYSVISCNVSPSENSMTARSSSTDHFGRTTSKDLFACVLRLPTRRAHGGAFLTVSYPISSASCCVVWCVDSVTWRSDIGVFVIGCILMKVNCKLSNLNVE